MKAFDQILKEKREYYGNTEAAIEFAADEYARQFEHYESIVLNEAENKVMNKTVELWNEFRTLEEVHNDHVHDVRFHIHAIQAIIISRDYIRKHKK